MEGSEENRSPQSSSSGHPVRGLKHEQLVRGYKEFNFGYTISRIVESAQLTKLRSEVDALATSKDAGYYDRAKETLEAQGESGFGEGQIILAATQLIKDDLLVLRDAAIAQRVPTE